jgi:hypothetical protein
VTARLRRLYPFLFAAIQVLYVAYASPGQFALADLVAVLGFTLAATGAIYGLALLALRRWGGPDLPALLTFLAVVGLFSRRLLRGLGLNDSPVLVLLAGAAVGALVVWWLGRRSRLLERVGVFLTLTGALLVLRFSASIVADRVRAGQAVEHSALARDLARPIAGPSTVPSPARDIYVLVLDEYANDAVLREHFGFDNRAFLDSLRALGFHLPAVSSNYTETTLSLPSLLNAAHLDPAGRELPADETDPTLMRHLLERSRVAAFLRERGYRYVYLPSPWWRMSQGSPLADSTVQVWSGLDVEREISRTELRRVLRQRTLLNYIYHDDRPSADHVRRTLEAFSRLPSIPEPVFAFAHLMSPHWPYVFDRSCRPPGKMRNRQRAASYVAQVECLNQLVLRTVHHLLEDSEVTPVIILQSDHGTATQGYYEAGSAREMSPAAARERFGAFGAYYLPAGGAAAFGDTVTVVNVLGNVLRHYFAADLPREPDTRYVVASSAPFVFHAADSAWLLGAKPLRPPSPVEGFQ